ncbi:MAG TPA: HD domain-containing phosphohydrolase [Beijerinckiaceae bacterium]|jgi:putative two-component system response regulator
MYAVVLDDAELNNLLMTEAIRGLAGCEPVAFTRPEDALAFVRDNAGAVGIAVTDYDMPGMNGVDFIRAARALPGFAHVPIVMVTSNDARALRRAALEAGATDFLQKPFDAVEVRARVANLLALNEARRAEASRAAELAQKVAEAVAVIEDREREIVMLLMKAAEHRDADTGDHVGRVSAYVALIAEGLGLEPERCRQLSLASTMHDVGKIAVPDAILLKPGALDAAERAEMEEHAARGARILESSSSDLVRLAAEIAASHHERFDGAGYPRRLKGEAIPLSGRIVAVADVFDALTSERPYKQAWPLPEARAHLVANAGTHFDPACVEAFLSRWSDVERLAGGNAAAA